MDLDDAARQLYQGPPADFVRQRDELAALATKEGDKGQAAAIRKLKKPTIGAWLANLLVHQRGQQVDELLHLGEMLREAHLNLSGEQLRELSRQRHQVVASLVVEARGLARDTGQEIRDDSAAELEATLSAALASEEAAQTLRSGRLTKGLEHTGFGPLEQFVSESGATSGAPADKQVRTRAADRGAVRRREAERDLRDAETAENEVSKGVSQARQAVDQLNVRLREREERVTALERELADAKGDVQAVTSDLRDARSRLDESERAARAAETRVRRARAALEHLRE